MSRIPHFFDHMSAQEKVDLFGVFEHWPELLSYFENNHLKKEQASAMGDEEELERINLREKKQIERIFTEIIPLMERKI